MIFMHVCGVPAQPENLKIKVYHQNRGKSWNFVIFNDKFENDMKPGKKVYFLPPI